MSVDTQVKAKTAPSSFPSQQSQTYSTPPPSLARPPPQRAWTISESTPATSLLGQPKSILLKTPTPSLRLEIRVDSVDTLSLRTNSRANSENDLDLMSPDANSGSCSSSDASADMGLATPCSSNSSSTSSSLTRTRADTLASGCTTPSTSSPSISFAPLPKLAPRKRNSNRPLGIAARGQILRARRQMMAQDVTTYYVDQSDDPNAIEKAMEEANSIPGGFKTIVVSPEQAEMMRAKAAMQAQARAKFQQEEAMREEEEEELERDGKLGEDPLIALGRLLNDATKMLWRRVSSSKIKDTPSGDLKKQAKSPIESSASKANEGPAGVVEQGLGPRRGKSWPSRLRAASIHPPPTDSEPKSPPSPSKSSKLKARKQARDASDRARGKASGAVTDTSDSDSIVEELWKKERAEDPMTRTIVSGSDDEDAFEHYVLSNDSESTEGVDTEDNGTPGKSAGEEDEEDDRSIADVALGKLDIGKAS